MRVLDVYLNNNFVGELVQDDSGELEFTYDQNYLENGSHAISLSLPLTIGFSSGFSNDFFKGTYKGPKVKAFFSGLLPEESVRHRLATYLGVSEKNPFALLEIIGGDCAGALALYPKGERPPIISKVETEALDERQLKEVLNLIKRQPMLAGDDGYRLSLAGAQDKLAVGFENGKVLLIKNGAPTTHILKPIIDRIQDSAHNELFCMRLAQMVGLDVPKASLHYVGDTPYYLVERYDRFINKENNVERIHQEDFCQAMGIAPEIKYEREGGPNVSQCQNLITQSVNRPASDQIKFLNMLIFNYLIGNADAHGKNFSLLYHEEKPNLAPAYDLLSTTIYLELSEKMAMKIGGKYKPRDVFLRHWYKIVPDTKTAQAGFKKQIEQMSKDILDQSAVLKENLKGQDVLSPVFDKIMKVIDERTARLKD